MTGADFRMRQAGDDGEVVAQVLENVEVWRERGVLACLLREKVGRGQAERRADGHHAGTRRGGGARRARGHRGEPGQGERYASGAKKSAAANSHRAVLVLRS